MIAYISTLENGKAKIEIVDDLGIHLDTLEVSKIHLDIKKEHIEHASDKAIPKAALARRMLGAGSFAR